MGQLDVETYQLMEKVAKEAANDAAKQACTHVDLKLAPIQSTLTEIHQHGCMMGVADRTRIDGIERCVEKIKSNAEIASSRPRQIITAGSVSLIIAIIAGVLNWFGIKVEATNPAVASTITNANTRLIP